MKNIITPFLILFLLTSCSLFRKKSKKPEDKKVFCETLKDSFEHEKALDLKKLRAFAGNDAYSLIAAQWNTHKEFYEGSLKLLENSPKLRRLMKKTLGAKKKGFKSLSSIYGQFYSDLSSVAKDKHTSQVYLSNLIDVDFKTEHQEKFKDIQFDEDSVFAGFYAEVVSDFLNDDLYIRLSKPLALESSGEAYSPNTVEFRLHGKKFLHMYVKSSNLFLKNNRSMSYFFTSQSHNLKPETQSFYKNLSYSVDGELRLDSVARNQFMRSAKKKCLKSKKK